MRLAFHKSVESTAIVWERFPFKWLSSINVCTEYDAFASHLVHSKRFSRKAG